MSEATCAAAGARVIARPVDVVAVKGKARGVKVLLLLAVTGLDTDAEARAGWALARHSAEALDAYLARRFETAAGAWNEVLRLRADDPVATLMLARCLAFQAEPPPPEWDGVSVAREK